MAIPTRIATNSTDNTSSSPTTLAQSFGSAIAAGSDIYVYISLQTATVTSVTDAATGGSNAYTHLGTTLVQSNGGITVDYDVWLCANSARALTSVQAVTAHFSGAADFPFMIINATTAGTLDGTILTNAPVGASTTYTSGAKITSAPCYVMTFGGCGDATLLSSLTAGSGWVMRNTTPDLSCGLEDQTQGSAGSITGTMTASPSSHFGVILVAVKDSGGTPITVAGPAVNVAISAPAGTVTAGAQVAGPIVNIPIVAPVGAITAGAQVAGPVVNVAIPALAGTIAAGVQLPGPVIDVAINAPVGSVSIGSTPITVNGPVVDVGIAGLAGTVGAGVVIIGPIVDIGILGLAGSVTAGQQLIGSAVNITIGALAGNVQIGPPPVVTDGGFYFMFF